MFRLRLRLFRVRAIPDVPLPRFTVMISAGLPKYALRLRADIGERFTDLITLRTVLALVPYFFMDFFKPRMVLGFPLRLPINLAAFFVAFHEGFPLRLRFSAAFCALVPKNLICFGLRLRFVLRFRVGDLGFTSFLLSCTVAT